MSEVNYKKSIFINAPLEKVYKYVVDPETWSQWDAHVTDVAVPKGDGGVGTVVEMNYSLFGIKHPNVVEVTEDIFNPEASTWVAKLTGDTSGYYRVTFLPKDEGTELTFEISQTIPEKLLAKVISKVVISKARANATVHCLENIKAICEEEYVPVV